MYKDKIFNVKQIQERKLQNDYFKNIWRFKKMYIITKSKITMKNQKNV